jgi:putative ABC transport system ATP-binding protein
MIKLTHCTKTYWQDDKAFRALDDVSLDVQAGQIVVILGASGSGKTTLLNVLAGLDTIEEGTYEFANAAVHQLEPPALTVLRKEQFGFIFQSYHLLEQLNVFQNVSIGASLNPSVRRADLEEMITLVGLADKMNSDILELSGGQQQRVAIARALAKKPQVLFCDEPTGALDEQTSKDILKLMLDLNDHLGTTMIIVTHNPIIAEMADKIIVMRDGKIDQQIANTRKNILALDWSL